MKIGVTTGGCDSKSGMSRYIARLLHEFASLDEDVEFEVLLHPGAEGEYLPASSRLRPVHVSPRFAPALPNVAWHQTVLPWTCRRRAYDVLFLPAANRRVPVVAPCPTVGTVHDLASVHVRGKYDPARTFYQLRVLPFLIRRLSRVITISESTRRDIVEHCGIPSGAIEVIHSAADTDVFRPPDPAAATERVRALGVRPPYVVYVSRLEHPGKNHVRLIQAFERLKEAGDLPHELVLGGTDWSGAEVVHEAARRSPQASAIRFLGFVADADLPALYGAADVLAFPSLFEGFGLPILEAMACGTAVACADVSSMPEIAGGAAALFDPRDVDAIVAALRPLLSSPERRAELAARGLARSRDFSWRETARRTLHVLVAAAEGGRAHA